MNESVLRRILLSSAGLVRTDFAGGAKTRQVTRTSGAVLLEGGGLFVERIFIGTPPYSDVWEDILSGSDPIILRSLRRKAGPAKSNSGLGGPLG